MPYPVRYITLTRGHECRVSAPDYERFGHLNWFYGGDDCPYAKRTIQHPTDKGSKSSVYLHRAIMYAPPALVVNHKDGDTLNCTRENLELALGRHNSGPLRVKKGKLGYAGVDTKRAWLTGSKDFRCRASIKGVQTFLGHHDTAEEAARVYDRFMVEHYGHLAATNFPLTDYLCPWDPGETYEWVDPLEDIPF